MQSGGIFIVCTSAIIHSKSPSFWKSKIRKNRCFCVLFQSCKHIHEFHVYRKSFRIPLFHRNAFGPQETDKSCLHHLLHRHLDTIKRHSQCSVHPLWSGGQVLRHLIVLLKAKGFLPFNPGQTLQAERHAPSHIGCDQMCLHLFASLHLPACGCSVVFPWYAASSETRILHFNPS